jgi:hypothetical protein
MCNIVSAQIEWLRLRCLRLKSVCHLFSSPSANHLSCARKTLSECEVLSNGTDLDLGLASVEEVEKTNVAVGRLSEAIDSAGIACEELRVAVGQTEKLNEVLMAGLDRLTVAVNKLFTVVIGSRNIVLDSYKAGQKR